MKETKVNSSTQDTDVDKNEKTSKNLIARKMRTRKSYILLSKIKRRMLKHVIIIRGLILVVILLLLYLFLVFSLKQIAKTNFGSYLSLVKNFVSAPANKIKSSGGRTNILILGKGGVGHEAPDLTDSVILASVSYEDPKIDLISLPRDIWLTDLRAKLNSIYYWGNQKEPDGGGLVLTKSVVEEISGLPVYYAVVIDFSGFEEIIDTIDGVDVMVENSFTDEKYPIAGKEDDLCGGDPEYRCRYETLHFVQGRQHMDGVLALKFVRSRNAEGDEGTDLARAARQQLLLSAIKDKVGSREILLSPKKLLKLKEAVLDSIETDITPAEGSILARYLFNARNDLTQHFFPENLLENPPKMARYDNLYVFIPKNDDDSPESDKDWSEVQKWVKCILNDKECN